MAAPATDVVQAEPPAREDVPAFQRIMERLGPLWTLGVLIILVVIFGVLSPELFTKAAWLSTSSYAVEYLILAVGQTFVIITAGIDLSDGAILGFSAMAGAVLMNNMLTGHSSGALTSLAGIAVMIGTGTAIGVLNGLIITRVKLPPFIVTLGTLTAVTGATDLLNNGGEVTNLPPFIANLGNDSLLSGWLPYPVLIALVIALVFGLILARTRFGVRTYAIGSNETGTRRSGIRVDRHLVIVYGISGFLAGDRRPDGDRELLLRLVAGRGERRTVRHRRRGDRRRQHLRWPGDHLRHRHRHGHPVRADHRPGPGQHRPVLAAGRHRRGGHRGRGRGPGAHQSRHGLTRTKPRPPSQGAQRRALRGGWRGPAQATAQSGVGKQ